LASLRKRNGKWQVRIKRTGLQPIYKSFNRKCDAQLWARQMEAEADRHGLPANVDQLKSITVADLIDRYDREVVALKRCAKVESDMLKVMKREPFARLPLSRLSTEPFTTYRDKRVQKVKAATVCRELGLLQHMFEIARKEMGFPLRSNPLAGIRKPKINNRRDRRISPSEWQKLSEAAQRARCPEFWTLVQLAVETGMRRSELLNSRWCDVDLHSRLLHIPQTKNGLARTIPLTERAVELLSDRLTTGGDAPFSLTPNAVRLAWDRLTERAGVEDLHFHDLRHEAISRFFERGLSVPEVALISGHKDYRMLSRYTHLRASDILRKL
jgi:integrase